MFTTLLLAPFHRCRRIDTRFRLHSRPADFCSTTRPTAALLSYGPQTTSSPRVWIVHARGIHLARSRDRGTACAITLAPCTPDIACHPSFVAEGWLPQRPVGWVEALSPRTARESKPQAFGPDAFHKAPRWLPLLAAGRVFVPSPGKPGDSRRKVPL